MDSETMDRSSLEAKVASELHTIAEGLGIEGHQRLKKADLIDRIVASSPRDGQAPAAEGGNVAAGESTDGATAVATEPAPAPPGSAPAPEAGNGEVTGGAAEATRSDRETRQPRDVRVERPDGGR